MGGTRYDVVVVGGGPAGLVTAETAASLGLRTLVVEREVEIGMPVHTSGATSPDTLIRYGIPSELSHGVARMRFCGPNTQTVFEYESPVMSVIDVRGTYKLLATRAEASGAEVRTGTRAVDPVIDEVRGRSCRLVGDDGSEVVVETLAIVDASGYRAAISKQVGLHPGFTRFGVGAEYDMKAPHCRQDEAVFIVGTRYSPAGYAWVFPWGEDRVRVGVGIHHGDVRSDPRDFLETFITECGAIDVDLREATIAEYHRGLIPAERLAERFVGSGVLAVGDAACQASLVAGEGIRIGMDAGRLAGQALARAVNNGRLNEKELESYEREFRAVFHRKLAASRVMNRRLSTFDDEEWDEKVLMLGKLPASVIPDLLQAEISAKKLFVAFAMRPRLWPRTLAYGVRGLIRSARGKA